MTESEKALVYAAALQCSSNAAIASDSYSPANFDAIVADAKIIADKMIDAIEAK